MPKNRNPETPSEQPATARFDEGVAQLEAVVKRLESGDLSLEDALSSFEQGIALVRGLSERLTAAEAQIEVLTRSATGDLERKPHDSDDA